MKLFVFAGLLALSAVANARTCKLEMIDPRGEFVTSIRTQNDPDCELAARACANWRVWYYAPAQSQCYRVRDDGQAVVDYIRYPDFDAYYGYPGSPYSRVPRTPPSTSTTTCRYDGYGRQYCRDGNTSRPTPQPTRRCEYDRYGREYCRDTNPEREPNPTPRCEYDRYGREYCRDTNPTRPTPTDPTYPTPTDPTYPTPTEPTRPTPTEPTTPTTPNPSATDSIRAIEAGETVIFNSAPHIVVSVVNRDFYNLKPTTGREVKEVARHYVAVTRGCHAGFCGGESVIVVASASYAAVAAIEYDGQLVTKTISIPETMTFDVNPNSLAWTKGCTPEGSSKVCVGNVVVKGRTKFTVKGIQFDGNVVIENNDGPKTLTVNVNPASLANAR